MKRYLLFIPLAVFLLLGAFWVSKNNGSNESQTPTTSNSKILNGVDFSDGKSVDVIDYNGDYLLVSKLRIGEAHPRHATGDGCGDKHWHADADVTAVNSGKILSDPIPGGCGFGTLSERPAVMYFPHELLVE